MRTEVEFNFSDREVLVIGASRGGIGSAIARGFADAKADVAITGIESEPIAALQGIYKYLRLDVTDHDAILRLAAATKKLDVLVNCAAITSRGEEMDPGFFSHVLDVNLQGTFRTAKAFREHLADSRGSLINIASMYATFGSPKNPAYGASKAGVAQLTKSLAIAWASDGIRVNSIAPGFIVTEQSAKSRLDPAHVSAVESRTPLGRWGLPEDIVGTVLFLASSSAGFITGACIPVDGGYSVV
ncbi:MAG: SDR family oxidoreductase [Albidovulum sp.]|nr:SDR family oxidoreductase [Albidovulum sp.]